MEKLIYISSNKDRPIRDFFKPEFEVIESKTEEGVEYYVIRERTEFVRGSITVEVKDEKI